MCEIDPPRFCLFVCLFLCFMEQILTTFLTCFVFSFSCLSVFLFSQGAGVHFHAVVPRPLADCFFVVL